MIVIPTLAALAAATLTPGALHPVILADTNRDGIVDATDAPGKTEWTAAHGAILLPNIGDSARRCPSSADRRLSDAQLEACNDAEGEVPRAPAYFAPVRTLPMTGLSDRAYGQIAATGAGRDKIRIFVKRASGWQYLAPADRLTARELRAGAILGVDSRDVIRDSAVWDGRVMLRFAVTDGGVTGSDEVAMRVAPVIIHNHTQRAEQILAPESGDYAPHRQFVADLSGALADAGFTAPIRTMRTTDNWGQDFVEFGYVSMPKAGGGMTMIRLAIRSPQPGRHGGRAVFDLRGPGMGAVQTGGTDYHQADSFGNLEAIPPYILNGTRYAAGRVIYGDVGDGLAPHRDFTTFFASQEVQAPVVLDTSWLSIGHVDEFVQFLPADTPRGWKIAILDIDGALALFRRAQKEGHGGVRAFSRGDGPQLTIDQLLADRELLRLNELARRRIALNLDILRRATGVAEDEIVHIPGLFQESEIAVHIRHAAAGTADTPPPAPEGLPPGMPRPDEKIVYGPGLLLAMYPGAVNGIVVDRTTYIAPKQFGPVIDGVDILQAAIQDAYAQNGMAVHWIDDWRSHHIVGGEVHCGTNAIREVQKPWW